MTTDLLGDKIENLDDNYTEAFLKFWDAFPKRRRKNRKKAFEAWRKNGCEAMADTIIANVQHRAKKDIDWIKSDGAYVPMPTTYLNGGAWSDGFQERKAGTENQAPTEIDEPPPQGDEWKARINGFLLKECCRIKGEIRNSDMENIILPERDRFAKQMRDSYGENVKPEELDEYRGIVAGWKRKMSGLFNKYRHGGDADAAVESMQAEACP